MSDRTITGSVATVVTVAMKLPQIYHTLKHKRTKDLSMIYLLLTLLGHCTWVIYAYIDNINIPLLICDGVCIFLSMILIGLKIHYDKINKEKTEEIEN